jgi:hypothetical protein
MIQPSSFLNNYSEEAFKDFRTRVLLDSGFFESEEGTKPTFVYNNSILTTPLDSDAQEFIKATGIKDNTIVSYINTYVVKLKRFGLWSKMKALYPFISDHRNLASYTEASTTGYSSNGVSVNSTTQPSPINTNTAVRIIYNTPGNPYYYQDHTLSANTQYVFSVYLRAVSGTPTLFLHINHASGGGDVTAKSVTLSTTWQRYEVTFNTAAFSNNFLTVIKQIPADIEFWGWQLELGSTATAYQPVLGASSTVYTNQFKYNLKDPRDLDAAFRLTFSGGWQFSQLGATPNGTNAYADTKVNPSLHLTLNSTHLSIYQTTNITANVLMGVVFSSALEIAPLISGIDYNNVNNSENATVSGYTRYDSLILTNRVNSTQYQSWYKNIKLYTLSAASTSLDNGNIFISGRNAANPQRDSNTKAFASIGDGLTDADATNLYYITEELQANLKRNVSPYTQFRGILDEYPGAAAAYSLRRLSGSYGGPLIKVRRSSDNTEQDIFPLGNGSLDTTSLLSFVGANNGFVTTWYDQSSGLNHLVQSDAAKQPSIVTSGVVNTYANRPNLTFDGVNDTMEKAFTISGTLNLVMVNRRTGISSTAGTNFVTLFDAPLVNNNIANVGYKNDASPTGAGLYPMDWNTNGNTLVFPQLSNLSPFIYSFLIPGTVGQTGYQYINNKTYSTTYTFNPSPANPVNLGGVRLYSGDSGGENPKGECYEVILYNFDNSSFYLNIANNINNYYNIYWDGSRKGLLDFYPNAAAAYSVRALSSSYRGPLVKVRRSSDNVERDFFALQNGNLDTFGLATFCAGTDGFVTTWYDQSGVGRNATQSTAANQPQIVINGVVTNDGVTNAIKFNDSGAQTLSFNAITNIRSVFHVHKLNTITSGFNIFFLGGSSFYDYHGSSEFYLAAPYASLDILNGVNKFNGVVTNLANKQYNLNRNFISLIHTASTGRANTISADRTETNRSWKGFISEIVLYSSDQTSNRNNIELNINTYYTIY